MTMHRVFFTAIQIDGSSLMLIHIDTKLDLAACNDLGGLLVETTRAALALVPLQL